MVPLHWPVNLLSSFLTTSFKQILHEQCEGKIMKAINAGQNRVVNFINSCPFLRLLIICQKIKEHSWLLLQQHGMVIEEDVEDQSFGGFETSALSEKLALQADDLATLSDSKEVI